MNPAHSVSKLIEPELILENNGSLSVSTIIALGSHIGFRYNKINNMGHGPHAGNVVAPSNFVLCIASCSNVPVICCWHIVLFLAIIT